MLELPAILADWKRLTGQRWSDLARDCEVDWGTLNNWRKGVLMPWDRRAARLAAVLGSVVGRDDLMDVIARDRAEIAKLRANRPKLAAARHPTPRTLVIPRADDRGGAA